MRIIQLSDIHLSSSNKEVLTVHYLNSLIEDLQNFQPKKPIDIILLTGDLVDKGGKSLGKDPYGIFRKLIIDPIIKKLNLKNNQILFIPGNHDIEREYIDEENEYFLVEKLTTETANDRLKLQKKKFVPTNRRIKKFKSFEDKFHKETEDYTFSNNESIAIVSTESVKVGFALINDSWRCSSSLEKENHFIGTDQLHNATTLFTKNDTAVNIAVFHHPLEMINSSEKEEIEGILQTFNFNIAFFGHTHNYKYESILGSNGDITVINGRSAFNNPKELQSKYQPGYNVLDLDLVNKSFTIYARKYIHGHYRFDKDVDFFPDGEKSGMLSRSTTVSLTDSPKSQIDNLPISYSADVNKIVKLLIGKSLYPDQYIFVRELIQNSVDACNRKQEKYTNLTPKIIIKVSTLDNSFEIIDEGDGMNKEILRNHFSIVGKSISQEPSDTLSNVNLISQFGIGFISTFIVAQTIYIRTKSEEDELINFEIEDVFKGFNYNNNSSWGALTPESTGTSVKVYLKKNYNSLEAFNHIRTFCRHVNNLEFYLNGVLHNYNDSWNLEDGAYFFSLNDEKYTCNLAIGQNYRPLIASNSGFLIGYNPSQIIPPRFPTIIGGEVNFKPRSIDFDLSRTNIMETQKSLDFKRAISVSLKNLFRKIIDSQHNNIMTEVLNYLMYYLTFYEENESIMSSVYSDFYSRKELINLCANSLKYGHKDSLKSLAEILIILKNL